MKRNSIFLSLLAIFWALGVNAQKVVSVYNGQSEISAPSSVTLTDGFYVPAGSTLRIVTTGMSYVNCQPLSSTPSANINYILTRTFRREGVNLSNLPTLRNNCEENQKIEYLDGHGRPLQTVFVQASPGGADIVQPYSYDMFGRSNIQYQTYTVPGNGGAYRTDALQPARGLEAYYSNPPEGVTATDSPFSRTQFDYNPNPLNKIIGQGAPGAQWQPFPGGGGLHTIKTVYSTNLASEVRAWVINLANNGGVGTGYFPESSLHKKIIKDENWKDTDGKAGTIEEFKDVTGKVVLKRSWETDTKSLSTYYLYDDFGDLRYVLPPAVNENGSNMLTSFDESQTAFENYIYGYHYDGLKHLIEKKIPGKGWEYMVYNKLDQITHTQDANQRALSQWSWIKYDALGRVILTGVENGQAISRAGMQSYNDGVVPQWEERTGLTAESYTRGTHPEVGEEYTNVKFHIMNYYDDYSFPGYSSSYAASVPVSTRTKGLTTGSWVRILNTDIKLLTVTYYDEYGRIKEMVSDNAKGGKDRTVNSYSFSGELTSSVRTHDIGGDATTIISSYDYDHMGRKSTIKKQINNGNVLGDNVVLSEFRYNEIGQLSLKKLHNGMQNTAITYNERGWLKSTISNEFSIKLDYQENGGNQWNGNISRQFWSQNASPSTSPNVFSYGYDRLNRLTSGASTGIYMSEVLNYDNMGNINQLGRDGGAMNQYYYNGNRLDRVDNVTSQYIYDDNGNVKTDGRTGMQLSYNLLNLPSGASGNGKVLNYVYDAHGSKLRKVVTESGLTTSREYIDGIEYDGDNIDVIHTEEGVAQRNGDNSYSYHYNLSDHLGNVRYTFDVYNGLIRPLQVYNYYPFGMRNGLTFGNNKYLYNGKEVQDELGGQLDYGARFYDPVIGRWNVVDPLSELSRKSSPYNYALNNPIRFVDVDGLYAGEVGKYKKGDKEFNDVLAYFGFGENKDEAADKEENKNDDGENKSYDDRAFALPTNPLSFKLKKVGESYYTNITYEENFYDLRFMKGKLKVLSVFINSLNVMVSSRDRDGKFSNILTVKAKLAAIFDIARVELNEKFVNREITTDEQASEFIVERINQSLPAWFSYGKAQERTPFPWIGAGKTNLIYLLPGL